jgi:hypothetical protein
MLDITVPAREATTVPNHVITSESKLLITFDARAPLGQGGTPATWLVAPAIREALERVYPSVTFQIRYRTSRTFRPSWVEVTWSHGPSELEAEAVVSVALRRLAVRP